MNKIYKVIWSKVKNAYVVVSEIAKSHSKNKSQSGTRGGSDWLRLAVVASLVAGSALSNPMIVDANNAWGSITGTTNVAVSNGASASGTNSVAVGNGSTATGTNAAAIAGGTAANDYSIAIGLGSIAGTAGATNKNALAIGYNAIGYSVNDVVLGANQTAIAANYGPSEDTPDGTGLSSAFGGRILIGHDNIAYGRAGNSVVVGSNNRSNAVHGIAIGQNAVAGQPASSTLAYENTMSIGTNTRSYSTDAIAIGNNAVAGNTDASLTSYDGNGTRALAIGSGASATSYNNVAVGAFSKASAISATAVGDTSLASAENAVAVGFTSKATSIGALAAGAGSVASSEYTIALGDLAQATNLRAMAVGYGAVASGGGAIALGRTSQATASYATSLGYENTASGASSLSVGYHTYAYGTRSIAIGREAVSGTASTGPDSIAIGYQTNSTADSTIAIGKTATTDSSATSAIALGSGAAANVATSVAIGSGSSTSRATDTTSQGWNNQDSTWSSWLSTKGNAGTTSGGVWNSSAGVVSIGTDGASGTTVTRKLTGLAAGQYDTDAVNMKQWTNTMLATTGDFKDSSYTTTYGSDGTPRTVTKLLNQSLKITGGVDNTLYYQSDFTTDPNIGAVISDNTVTLRLNKTLRGLETIYLTNPTTGTRTTVSGNGVTIRPTSGSAVSLTSTGLNNGGNTITNVAAGVNGTDGVNVTQLNQAIAGVSGGSGTTTTVTVEGGTAAGTSGTYTGNNLQITSTTGTNSTAYDLKLADKVTLGSTSTDGSLTVNGTGGSSVAVDGATGSVALTGTDGSTATIAASTAANDVNGNSLNRITAGGATVATLNDGMVYTGDTGTAAVKLNKTVNIVGGETDSSKLSTDNNIGIVAEQDGDNGKLTVRLAKDITGLNTVEAGDAVLGNQGVATAGGVAQDGSYVTGLDNTTWNVTSPDIVSGRAATEDQLKTVSDAVVAVTDGTSENATGGFGLTDDSGTAVKQDLGKTIQIAGDGNITTTANTTDGKITVGLSNTVSVGAAGTDGANGTVTVNGTDGSSVAINGADGTIALTSGSGSPVTIGAGSSVNDVTGTPINRITVGGATVATLNDGMKYGGDFGTVSNVKLNNQVDVKGEATTEANLTTGNIGVVSSQNGDNGLLVVKLNKDVDLGTTGSLTLGNTVVNNSGLTITGGPSVTSGGIDAGSKQITNVATGVNDTDAVNVKQLRDEIGGITGGSGTATTITVEGGTAAGTSGTYTGSNLQVTSTTATDGSKTYDMKLADKITLGSAADSTAGTTGTDGAVTVNGADGSAVAINGADGSIALNTADGSPVTIKAGTAANDVNGNSINRITVGDATVATLDDGMVYTGDTGTAAVKLNKTVNIVGGETDSSKLSTDNNIGIVAEQDGDNGKLTVRLAKDITGLNTVEAGDAVIGNQGVVTAGGVAQDGSYVTGLDNTTWNVSNPDIVTGRAATEDQLKTVSDAIIDGTSENAIGGFGLTDDSGTAVKQDLGKTIQIAGDGNITTTANTTDGKITVGLSNTVSVGTAGTDGANGTVTVNGTDGSSVAINGADGTIALNTADGSPVTIGAGTQVNNLAGTPVDRITVGGQTVATMSDGLKFAGDDGQTDTTKVIPKTLNEQLDIIGGADGELTDKNIGVNNVNGQLKVQLVKDVDLGSTGSLTTGNTFVNNSGLTITNGPSVTSSGIDAGSKKITNVATGTDDTDAVNVGQLTKALEGVAAGEGSKTNLTVEGGTAAGTGGNYTGSNLQITEKTETTGATTYDVKLADNITLGSAADTEAGTEGTDSSITVNGKDGSAVAINGADGTIALNTADGSPVTIGAGTQVNNLADTPIDRITVGGATVATLDDGMKYYGDFGSIASVKLNNRVDVKGEATTEADLTTGNIGVVSSQDGNNALLTVKLNKDINLGETGSLTTGNTVVNNSGITITPATGDPVSLTASGLDNGNNVISNVATGVKGTDAVNVDQLTKAIAGVSAGEGSKTNLTVEGGTAAGTGGTYTGSNLQITEKTETTGATTYDVKLADKITLGSAADSAAGTTGTDGAVTVNGADGSAVAINGADGSIALNTADGSPVTIKAGTAANDVNGNSINRVTVGGATVATLDDGMVYTGDTGSAAVKLNKTVNIIGGETDSSKLSTDNNIGIVAEQDGDNGKLTVRLAKDITGLNTVEAGDAVIGNQGVVTAGGVAQDGSYVTGLDNTTWNAANPDIVSGRAATEDQLKTVSDAIIDGTSENAVGGFGLTDDSGTAVKQDLGKTIQIAGDGNITTTANTTDGKITVGLSNTVSVGTAGTDGANGTVTVNGTDGSSVAINGADGTIALTSGSGSPVTIAAGTSADDVTGTPINRITVGGATVATLNDGMKYGGDFGTVSNVKLNNQVDVKGEATTEADLTTGNIGVVSSQNGDNGLLVVKLNKDINLGSTGSLTLGNTAINNTGITITPATGSPVSLTSSGLDNGGNKIVNVAPGEISQTSTDAINGSQLWSELQNITGGSGTTTAVTVEGGTAAGTNNTYTGSNLQITSTVGATSTTYDLKLADNITLGSAADTEAGTEGTDSSITVNGKDGSAVAINGVDGTIALNTADGSPVTIQAGTQVNNLAGTPINRITVGGATVATLDDGMKYYGDFGTLANVKLNNQVNVKGEATTAANLTTGNIGVVSSQDGDNALLTIKLNKDINLGETGSLTTGNTVVNNDGITITPATGDPVSLTASGLDNGNNVISNVATGVKGTDAVNVDQLTQAIAGVTAGEGSKTNLTVEGGTTAGTSGNYTGSNLQITEKTETTGATTYDVKLADNITLGSANGSDGTGGVDGTITLTGADGSTGTIAAGPAANDVNGNSINRITVGGATVATLDDGMVYTGDTGSAAVKLNKTVNIVGGETDSSKLSTGNNIGIVAEQDGDNGKLTVRLAEDITGLNTVEAGDAVIGNQSVLTGAGYTEAGSFVTGLDNTEWSVTNPDIVSGRAATEDQLKTVSDAVVAVADGTSENATGGFGLADGSGTTVKQDLGKTITVKGGVTDGTATTDNPDGVSNITTTVKDGALEVSLNKDLDLGSTGSVTTGNTVVNNDGVKVGDTALTTGGLTITNGPSVTTTGIDAGSKQITNLASGSDGVDADGNPTYNNLTNGANIGDIKNITNAAKTELTNDGLNFTADSGDAVHRNLGETLNIAGDGNITTTSDATNGKITGWLE